MSRDRPLLRIQFYHDEAENLRRLAGSEDNEERRSTLLRVAESYEAMSKRLFDEMPGRPAAASAEGD